MAFCGIAKSGFCKRMNPTSIGFGETSDIHFVTAYSITSILQGILSYWHLETDDVLEEDVKNNDQLSQV